MKTQFSRVTGSIVAPRGFLASGIFCDIKRLGTGKGSEKGRKRDLALIVSEIPATVAGMFTTNQICAAPVKVCIQRVKKGVAQAIVVNSGNANACATPFFTRWMQTIPDARKPRGATMDPVTRENCVFINVQTVYWERSESPSH